MQVERHMHDGVRRKNVGLLGNHGDYYVLLFESKYSLLFMKIKGSNIPEYIPCGLQGGCAESIPGFPMLAKGLCPYPVNDTRVSHQNVWSAHWEQSTFYIRDKALASATLVGRATRYICIRNTE